MIPDKEIKKLYKPKFWAEPDKYYPTDVLKKDGFTRKFCAKCHKPFWNIDINRKVCGDPTCSNIESFSFIGKTPAKRALTYIEVWQEFSKMFKSFGYTPVKRYPLVARWNPTMEYTNASIAAFQPFVISGEVEPPANPLVIPQFCLRFGDIDNVGITMSHMTCFNMIGQHMFVSPREWDQNKVFMHIKKWLNDGLGLPDSELTFHEDAWAGGGNLGCCMEFFSRGCEIGNQVYMLYEQTESGVKDLKIKVLDMGMGMERNAWFSQGCNTIYDATFPTVIKKLIERTDVKVNPEIIRKFVPYAGLLNLDEIDDINVAWKIVSAKTGVSVEELKHSITQISAVYSIAEHTRGLLIALSDGALPSNVGGGYNLRLIARRAMNFIEENNWNLTLQEVCCWHAEYLKPLFPDLSEHLDDVSKILEVEKRKFIETRNKSKIIVSNLLSKGKISEEKLIEIYDSQGISPELVKKEAKVLGIELDIPQNFYARVSERHEAKTKLVERKVEIDLHGLPDTEILYYKSFDVVSFDATVLKVIGKNVILDRTAFYPTSGGQAHDCGTLGGNPLVDIYKQGAVVVHVLKDEPGFRQGEKVHGEIDYLRRLQLAQHHSATHIINGASRKILGNHIWQAGAQKDVDKARLDITHYEALTDEEVKKIEELSNLMIDKNIPIFSTIMDRGLAEAEYGTRIYQGGAVPGRKLRIVGIKDFDVEACGGTHLNTTGEVKKIKILKTSKIQDGIVRIEFAAGNAAAKFLTEEMDVAQSAARFLECNVNQVPGRANELFVKWKAADKASKKKEMLDEKYYLLVSTEEYKGEDILSGTAQILRTQPQHILKTLERFKKELDANRQKIYQ
ncbi:MAG: alanine--tRNA ligase [archaeon]